MAYTFHFRAVVARADQRERLEMYLRGLLDGAEPKNSEAIAARWAGDGEASGVAQALQHFLGTSPWDFEQFLSCYRDGLPLLQREQPRLWVVQDVVFLKKGRQSVGTQRQFARPLGRKVNCQVAVAVSELSPDGFYPLAIRLYLPGYWLREHQDLVERLVPAEHRNHLPRSEVAIQLIDQLRVEGRSADVLIADSGFLSSLDFIEGVEARKLRLLRPGDAWTWPAEETSLGDSFSARLEAWRVSEAGDKEGVSLAEFGLAETSRGFDWMRQNLGLDQFEGRSWLGWHHHASLVMAAYGFLASESLHTAHLPPVLPKVKPNTT